MNTWILLRGLMRESRHWGDFPILFQNAMGEDNVLTLDFPGNGNLNLQTSPSNVSEMAESCRDQLKSLGYVPPFRVLALSLGAMVAVEWCDKHPEEIDKLVLINTSLSPYNPFYHRLRPSNYFVLISSLLFSSLEQREKLILLLTSTQNRTKDQQSTLVNQWTTFAREHPVSLTNVLHQLRAAITFRAPSNTLSATVLLLAGQQDRLVNAKCSLSLAQRWCCTIKLHPTAGHDLPLDDGFWVAQQVKDWLVS